MLFLFNELKIYEALSKFDFHKHKKQEDSINNFIWNESNLVPDNPFSLSVHPWCLDGYNKVLFSKVLYQIKDNPNFVAIGECGLDKNIAFSMDFQISVLNEQYQFAKEFSKPMIIHCVGSYNQLLHWKKDKNDVKMAVHGFVRKLHLAEQLLKAGFYLSFGTALCENRPTLHETFRKCPIDRLFLETDDKNNFNIEDVYISAAEIKNINVKDLDYKINENKKSFF